MLKRIFALLLSAHMALIPAHALASQNQLSSPTTGTVSGLQLTNSYNNALDSVNTANSGASAPTNQLSGSPSVGNWWLNTSTNPSCLGMFASPSNWPAIGCLDTANNYWDMQIGGGVASVASAATTDLCNGVPQNVLTITGTTTVTSFGPTCVAGQMKVLTFSGILTLTYNATSLAIPGAANVTTAAGDIAIVVALGSGNWRVVAYTPASGQALINPAIDLGAAELTFSPNIPSSKYLWAYGQAVSRTTYASLLTQLTITQSVTRTNGSPTLTGFTDTTQINAQTASGVLAANIEGSGIPSGATIQSCTSTSCTMSANATSSGTANVTIFDYGNGDGATTFNLPVCSGEALAGRNNMGGTPAFLSQTNTGANPNALGAQIGQQAVAIAQANLPNVNFNVTIPSGQGSHGHSETSVGTATFGADGISSGGAYAGAQGEGGTPVTAAATLPTMTGTAASGGSGAGLPTVTPSLMVNCMIRVLSKLEAIPGALPALTANDDYSPRAHAALQVVQVRQKALPIGDRLRLPA